MAENKQINVGGIIEAANVTKKLAHDIAEIRNAIINHKVDLSNYANERENFNKSLVRVRFKHFS